MREIITPTRTPLGTGIIEAPVKALTNLPCDVRITIQINGGVSKEFALDDEADARNLLARLVPTSIITNNTEELLTHITDESQPLFEHFYAEAKNKGLDLPEGF